MVLSRRVFVTRGVLLVMKTLEDERYVVIKAYKCTVSEIWRDFFLYWHVLRVRRIPTYRVYRLGDIMPREISRQHLLYPRDSV